VVERRLAYPQSREETIGFMTIDFDRPADGG